MSTITESIGRVLAGRYRIESALGSGASANVFAAFDTTLQRRVAVKVLHPALAADGGFLRRFRAEAQSAAALANAHVLAVHDWGEDAQGPFLVLEFLGGRLAPGHARRGDPAERVPGGRGRGPGGRGARLRPRTRLRPPRRQARQPPLRRGGAPARGRLRPGPRPGRGVA